jgi:hypothetical protein
MTTKTTELNTRKDPGIAEAKTKLDRRVVNRHQNRAASPTR